MKRYLPYVGPVIGLTGIALALYFHAQSVQERKPTFYVSPQRAVIVDARGPASSDLQVLYRGKLVAASVTIVTVYLWNEGRMPIRANDVLGGPVTIELATGTEILEARIVKVSRPVIHFSLVGVSDNVKNLLPVSFDILEEGDGAAIQLTYAGDPSAMVAVAGTIVGAGSPRLLPQEHIRFLEPPSPKANRSFQKLAAYSLALMGLLLVVRSAMRIGEQRKSGKPITRFGIALLVGFVYVVGGVLLLYSVHRAESSGVPPAIWSEP